MINFTMDKSNPQSVRNENFKCENRLENYRCEQCDFKTFLRISLKNHYWSHHSNPQNCPQIDTREYTCEKCDFMSYSSIVCLAHQNMCNVSEDCKCFCCPFRALNRADLEIHVASHHWDSAFKCYQCDKCNYKTKKRHLLKNHLKTKKHKRNCQTGVHCNVCGYIAKTVEDLLWHSTTNHPEGVYHCTRCSFTTVAEDCFKIHISRAHAPKYLAQFECSQCSFKANCKRNLNVHIAQQHEKFKLFECVQCGYTSAVKSDFKRHEKTHSKFSCDACEFKSYEFAKMQKHYKSKHLKSDQESVRTNAECFQCDQCSYISRRKENLRKHISRNHTESENIEWFACDQCNYLSKRKDLVRLHIKRKHNLDCNVCGYKSKDYRELRQHYESHHPEMVLQCNHCPYRAVRQEVL